MTDDSFRPAQRTSAKPLIGLFSESGGGKTYNALLLARGFVGPNGRIAMIETESGRGEAYADRREYPEFAPAGDGPSYEVFSLRDDFSPARYHKAIKAAEAAKFDALIIDSGSHEWEGPGGVLAMAAKNAERMKGVLVWQQPKLSHQREFMLPLMQTPIPLVILCMRAKYPMEQIINNKGEKEWVRSKALEPKQSDDILYEMFVHGWFDQEHKFHLTKTTSKALGPIFADGKVMTIETGRKLAAWARGDAVTPTQREPATDDPFGLPPSNEERLEQMKAEGVEAAEGGLSVLAAWFNKLEKADKAALKPYLDETLKPMAVRADEPPVETGEEI